MREVEAVKTGEQRQQVEAHLAAQGLIYADIWKVGVNDLGPVVVDYGQRARAGSSTTGAQRHRAENRQASKDRR